MECPCKRYRWKRTRKSNKGKQDPKHKAIKQADLEMLLLAQKEGLYIFFLPPYCSQMNPIETQWHQLKSHEIAGQMFDNEYDLTITQCLAKRDRNYGWDESS